MQFVSMLDEGTSTMEQHPQEGGGGELQFFSAQFGGGAGGNNASTTSSSSGLNFVSARQYLGDPPYFTTTATTRGYNQRSASGGVTTMNMNNSSNNYNYFSTKSGYQEYGSYSVEGAFDLRSSHLLQRPSEFLFLKYGHLLRSHPSNVLPPYLLPRSDGHVAVGGATGATTTSTEVASSSSSSKQVADHTHNALVDVGDETTTSSQQMENILAPAALRRGLAYVQSRAHALKAFPGLFAPMKNTNFNASGSTGGGTGGFLSTPSTSTTTTTQNIIASATTPTTGGTTRAVQLDQVVADQVVVAEPRHVDRILFEIESLYIESVDVEILSSPHSEQSSSSSRKASSTMGLQNKEHLQAHQDDLHNMENLLDEDDSPDEFAFTSSTKGKKKQQQEHERQRVAEIVGNLRNVIAKLPELSRSNAGFHWNGRYSRQLVITLSDAAFLQRRERAKTALTNVKHKLFGFGTTGGSSSTTSALTASKKAATTTSATTTNTAISRAGFLQPAQQHPHAHAEDESSPSKPSRFPLFRQLQQAAFGGHEDSDERHQGSPKHEDSGMRFKNSLKPGGGTSSSSQVVVPKSSRQQLILRIPIHNGVCPDNIIYALATCLSDSIVGGGIKGKDTGDMKGTNAPASASSTPSKKNVPELITNLYGEDAVPYEDRVGVLLATRALSAKYSTGAYLRWLLDEKLRRTREVLHEKLLLAPTLFVANGSAPASGQDEDTANKDNKNASVDTTTFIREVVVYELERTNLTDFGSPFLPCEVREQWRWIDANGRKHPNISKYLTRREIQRSLTPPLDFGKLWIPRTEWQYVVDYYEDLEAPNGVGGTTDPDGWQYAAHFGSNLWSPVDTWEAMCRRRKWLREYV
ncbi:unnamed protein product [Amoebophrya sp. A25]|nr:unnamed protein product [Amoebophrya sp. A25]|eukprot:GSA25T00016375001.1